MNRIVILTMGVVLAASASPARAQQPFWNVTVSHGPNPMAAPVVRQTATNAGATRGGLNSVTIGGRATRSTGGVPNSLVRLRDARLGRIIDQQLTDRTGAFAFRNVGAGNYVIELLSGNQTTIAATQMINVNGGEQVTAIVRLPAQPSLFAGILGQQGATSAALSPSGLTEVVPTLVEQLPQVAVQSLPAVVPVGTPSSQP